MNDLFPPFAPDPLEPRRRRFKPVPFRVIAPNLITLLALCLGLTAIRLAYEGRMEPAVYAIVVAALLDGVDGRIARLLKGTSRFGAELDSLADFVNFGVTPALIIYSFVLHEDRKSTRLNSSHANISYAVFCLKKKSNSYVLCA